MKTTDTITPSKAVKLAKEEYSVSVTAETIRDWCDRFKIGRKVVGRYQINKKRLKLLLEGKTWEITQEVKETEG